MTQETIERLKMIKAMEFIMRHLNCDKCFCNWLTIGVANGDIEYGDLSIKENDEKTFEFYLNDENFADIMDSFLIILQDTREHGGLYCDKILSAPKKNLTVS